MLRYGKVRSIYLGGYPSIRDKQIERAQKMLDSGNTKKNRKNPNDPARFIGITAATKEGEVADIRHYLDEHKITEESRYDGRYAVCTDLLDDEVRHILKVSEGRWQIEECFRIMKTDFSARSVYLQDESRIKAHFLICFLALTIYRFLEKKLDSRYTCEEILDTLKALNFSEVKEQRFFLSTTVKARIISLFIEMLLFTANLKEEMPIVQRFSMDSLVIGILLLF